MLDLDAGGFVVGAEGGLRQAIEKLGQAGEKPQAGTELGEAGVADVVHAEVVEQALQIGELAVPFLVLNKGVALFPELRGINPELGE